MAEPGGRIFEMERARLKRGINGDRKRSRVAAFVELLALLIVIPSSRGRGKTRTEIRIFMQRKTMKLVK